MTIARTPLAACSVADVPEGTALRVELDDEPIAILGAADKRAAAEAIRAEMKRA